jgi:hypothetical protein
MTLGNDVDSNEEDVRRWITKDSMRIDGTEGHEKFSSEQLGEEPA